MNSEQCQVANIFFKQIRTACCINCLRTPYHNVCKYKQKTCKFINKIIVDENNPEKIVGSVWECKNCYLYAPNPVISICTDSKDLIECYCQNTPDKICKSHVVGKVIRANAMCVFRDIGGGYSECMRCECIVSYTAEYMTRYNIHLVCRLSYRYSGLDYMCSEEILHRFIHPRYVFFCFLFLSFYRDTF